MTKPPVRRSAPAVEPILPVGPKIVIVGSGPSGCYTAQALCRALPGAEITVVDRLLVPYGLVRHGVAADHQGTKAVTRQFDRLFQKDGVDFVGSVEVGTDISLNQLRSDFDAVVLASGMHADVSLDVPGWGLPGVHGAGRITRLFNAHPEEARPAPSLGENVAVVGHGNVAMDIIRLLAKRGADLTDSDIDDEAHRRMSENLAVLHAFGRSEPSNAKFDPAMMHEILDLPGIEHVVHGVGFTSRTGDPRSELVSQLAQRPRPEDPYLRIEWYFGYEPRSIEGTDRVSALVVADRSGDELVVPVTDVITAIGFRAQPSQTLAEVSDAARESGKVDDGLYVAGWARHGPRGTIPSQRSDARELAELISAELTPADKPGRQGLSSGLAGATTGFDHWLLIDAHESQAAAPGRLRSKFTLIEDMRIIAGLASTSAHAELSISSAP